MTKSMSGEFMFKPAEVQEEKYSSLLKDYNLQLTKCLQLCDQIANLSNKSELEKKTNKMYIDVFEKALNELQQLAQPTEYSSSTTFLNHG